MASSRLSRWVASFNKVIIAGACTRDPELRYLPSGSGICNLGVAINRKWKTDSGEQKEEVCFVDVTAFGKQAETVAKYFKKGSPILIEGRLKLDSWDDKATGQKKTKLGVVLESFSFLDSGERQQGAAPQAARPAATKPATVIDESDCSVPY